MRPTIPDILRARANQGLGGRQISLPSLSLSGMPGSATAQEKILAVTRGMGIRDADIQQATTRTIFDSIPFLGNTFNFFEQCHLRTFNLTNLTENKLEVGEAMIIEQINFYGVDVGGAGDAGTMRDIGALQSSGIYWSDLSIQIANQLVLKDFPLTLLQDINNKDSQFLLHQPLKLDTLLCIPSLQEFIVRLKINQAGVNAGSSIVCALTGTGIIYKSPRSL